MTASTSERTVFERQGFGGTLGFGKNPALILVDMVNGFLDPDLFGGGNIDSAGARTERLLSLVRNAEWPVVMSRIVFEEDGSDANLFSRKVPALLELTETNMHSHMADQFKPNAGEFVIKKRLPSAFQETPLTPWLISKGVDTLIIAGATTSGCVRATVVDAMGAGFIPIVLSDCVGDRTQDAHVSSLFDIEKKYGDVVNSDDVIEFYQLM